MYQKLKRWSLSLLFLLCMAAFLHVEGHALSLEYVHAGESLLCGTATLDSGRVHVPDTGGGTKIIFQSQQAGYRLIGISYDYAHLTSAPLPLRIYVNGTEYKTVHMPSIANGVWGRYHEGYVIVPVRAGENEVAAYSGIDLNYFVNYMAYSAQTYASAEEVERPDLGAALPQSAFGRYEFEALANNEIILYNQENSVSYIQKGYEDDALYYGEVDFAEQEAQSIKVQYRGHSSFAYLEFMLDSPEAEPFAEGSLRHNADREWTTAHLATKTPVSGKHKLYVRIVKGDTKLDWFQFQTTAPEPLEAVPPVRDTYPDTWVATDDLDRTTPTYEEVGAPKDDKIIGMFYFICHVEEQGELYDHYKTYLAEGMEGMWNVMAQGPIGYAHYWGEPYFGYYRSDDEWVIRKHASMLVNAGVDFIFFDCSNNILYPEITSVILETFRQIRLEGGKTPQIVYFFGDEADRGANCIPQVYYDYYLDPAYEDLWFRWEGKPLVLGRADGVTDPEITNYFTFRYSWAWDSGETRWPWIDYYPQDPGLGVNGVIEQITVACGFHATTSRGRSFHNGYQPTDGTRTFDYGLMNTTTPLGLAFDEQWSRAYEVNPPVVMLTGWNEWVSGRWAASGEYIASTYISSDTDWGDGNIYFGHTYVDCFNTEYSRDLEPMKGGFGDNYYYQTVSHVRKYKGVRAIPSPTGQKAITVNTDFTQWESVGPEYRDTLYDTAVRNEPAIGSTGLVYTNFTGRNDIEFAKVSKSGNTLYFYVQTRANLSAPSGENWMNLFIDLDQNAETGWHGYDLLLNRKRSKSAGVLVEAYAGEGFEWTELGRTPFQYQDNKLHLQLDLSAFGLTVGNSFDFKWADNSVEEDAIMDFIDKGDAAPDDRFNFRYQYTDYRNCVFYDGFGSGIGTNWTNVFGDAYDSENKNLSGTYNANLASMSTKDTFGEGSALSMTYRCTDAGNTDTAYYMGAFIGVRMPDHFVPWQGDDGLWIGVRDSQITFKKGSILANTAQTVTFSIPVSFTEAKRLYIADSGDRISIYGGEDHTLLARVEVSANEFSIYDSAGNLQKTVAGALPAKGYLNIGSHHGEYTIDNVMVTDYTKHRVFTFVENVQGSYTVVPCETDGYAICARYGEGNQLKEVRILKPFDTATFTMDFDAGDTAKGFAWEKIGAMQ